MKKLAIIFSLLVFCFSVPDSFGQNNKYKLRGVFKTPDSSVIPALRIDINKDGEKSSAFTDINGEFEIELAPGNYELTVSKEVSDTFTAFIKTEENGLNPNFLEFTIEPNLNPCGAVSGEECPQILKSVKPIYPTAAKAVRASGEVEVTTKIDKAGNVISAKAIRGHTLLRTASETAAKQMTFSSSDNDEREIKLIYIFLNYVKEKENLKRFFSPYRILVNEEFPKIVDSVDY